MSNLCIFLLNSCKSNFLVRRNVSSNFSKFYSKRQLNPLRWNMDSYVNLLTYVNIL